MVGVGVFIVAIGIGCLFNYKQYRVPTLFLIMYGLIFIIGGVR